MNVFKRPYDPAYLDARVTELIRENKSKDQEIARLGKVLKSQKFDAEKFSNLNHDLGIKFKELEGLLQSSTQTALSIDNRTLVEDIRKHENVLRKLEDDLAIARQGRLDANESLRQLQESSFRGQDQPGWSTDTHEVIAGDLETLFKDSRMWCRNNCTRSLPELSGKPGEWPTGWENVMRSDPMILNNERSPFLILHALLMDHIYREIFDKPFFFVPYRIAGCYGEGKDQKNDGLAHGVQFQSTLDDILGEILRGEPHVHQSKPKRKLLTEYHTGNPEGGHAWRSQLLRLLDPILRADKDEPPQLETTKRRSQTAQEEATKDIIQYFMTGSAAHIICTPLKDAKAIGELERIFRTAVHMSHKLWLRRSSLEIQTLQELPSHFNSGHVLLRPHSLHSNTLTDNGAALDGQPIRIVVQPAILVRGKSDGSEYDHAVVLKPAVVWMG